MAYLRGDQGTGVSPWTLILSTNLAQSRPMEWREIKSMHLDTKVSYLFPSILGCVEGLVFCVRLSYQMTHEATN